jgi:hypothetical protein
MKIYNILINDRHADIELMPYKNKDKAIAKARQLARKYCVFKEDYEEYIPNGNWIFNAKYSCESDFVAVIEDELVK